MYSLNGGQLIHQLVQSSICSNFHMIVAFAVSLVAIFVLCFLFEGLVAFRAKYEGDLKESRCLSVSTKKTRYDIPSLSHLTLLKRTDL